MKVAETAVTWVDVLAADWVDKKVERLAERLDVHWVVLWAAWRAVRLAVSKAGLMDVRPVEALVDCLVVSKAGLMDVRPVEALVDC